MVALLPDHVRQEEVRGVGTHVGVEIDVRPGEGLAEGPPVLVVGLGGDGIVLPEFRFTLLSSTPPSQCRSTIRRQGCTSTAEGRACPFSLKDRALPLKLS